MFVVKAMSYKHLYVYHTVKLGTLEVSDSKNFDKINVDEILALKGDNYVKIRSQCSGQLECICNHVCKTREETYDNV